MPGEPLDDLGVLVDGVVVHDGMHKVAGGHLGLDGVEEADELLTTLVTRPKLASGHRGSVGSKKRAG
jgi:hypothetical protein